MLPFPNRFSFTIHCTHGVLVLTRFNHYRVINLLVVGRQEMLLLTWKKVLVCPPIMLTELLKEFF